MDADLSRNLRYHFRSNNDRIKVRAFSPDRNDPRVEMECGLPWTQDIRRNREEQVGCWRTFRSGRRADPPWDLFDRQGSDRPQ